MSHLRSIAFYLPQFHPVQENDEWWGRGFTEWTNVAKARPEFPTHYQPHLPADLGFYDLRLPEARAAQAELARAYGVDAFCYYHYWFNGRRILERPFTEVLASGEPEQPFCLAWANENWTRVWDGSEKTLLLEQRYSPEDDLAHIRSLREALTDPRYVTLDGRPLLLVYRASRLPDSVRTTDLWRREAQSWGLPDLHLARVESGPDEHGDPRVLGFDSAVDFAPRWWELPRENAVPAALRKLVGRRGPVRQNVFGYQRVVDAALARPLPDYPRHPAVSPGWDNSARKREHALILTGSTPERFGAWMEATLAREPASDLVFVNAWNEWAEGNHLEPDRRHGRAYLEAHLAAVTAARTRGRVPV